jgi:hypothetical protein
LNLPGFNDLTHGHPYVLVLAIAAVAALAFALHRARGALASTPAAVLVSAFGAALCTAYSGDTSWGFARDHLAMASLGERSMMFAAAEVALFSMALMARQNLRAQGAPGAPGFLVWVITAVQVIPAYSESGVIAGTVRAFVGPVLAALLWHLAMGIELRHAKPGTDSQSLPALVARELRERLLSRLGLARRGRDAAQISRDRWTGIATRRAARLAVLQASSARTGRLVRARRRLATAVDRTDAGVLPDQREALLSRLAAYRSAAELATVPLPSPWRTGAAEEPEATIPVTTMPPSVRRPRPPYLRHRRGRVLRRLDYRQVAEPEALDSVREPSGQVVTDPVIITPADLRRQAARFNKEMVSQTGRAVTIDQLRRALGLSRREATKLRREVVGAGQS